MNPYQFKVVCAVCGGLGLGTITTAAAEWRRSSFIYHTDPRVCASVLSRKNKEK